MLNSEVNSHSADGDSGEDHQLLAHIFFQYKQMEEDKHLESRLPRERPLQRRLRELRVKGLLNIARAINLANGKFVVHEDGAKHVIEAPVFVEVKSRRDGRAQNLIYCSVPNSFKP